MLAGLAASLSAPAASFALIAFPGLLAFAAISDLTRFLIPNWICSALVVAFFPVFALSGLGLEAFAVHLAMGIGGLALGFTLFALGVWGGGDGKLLGAVFLWFEPALALDLSIAIMISGGALGLLAVLLHAWRIELWMIPILRSIPFEDMRRNAPFGVAIAGGALLTLPEGALFFALLS